MPQAKYDYAVMGKVAKNSRNKAQKEAIELVKADEEHNFVTVMDKLNIIQHQLLQSLEKIDVLEKRFVAIEERLDRLDK